MRGEWAWFLEKCEPAASPRGVVTKECEAGTGSRPTYVGKCAAATFTSGLLHTRIHLTAARTTVTSSTEHASYPCHVGHRPGSARRPGRRPFAERMRR